MKTKRCLSRTILFLCMTIIFWTSCAPGVSTSTATSIPTAPAPSPTMTPYPTPTLTPTPRPTVDPCEDDDFYNGWLYHDTCIPGIITDSFWLSPNPRHFVGIASYYSKGIMETVLKNRGLSANGYHGAVALMNCGDIGKSVWIKRSTAATFQGPYLVADCSAKQHLYYNVMMTGIVVEVDFATAERWGMVGGYLPTVHVCKSKSNCGAAYRLSSWFERNVTWESKPNETDQPDPES